MTKRSTKETIHDLDMYMFKLADMIAKNEEIFTEGATIEDYEKLYHFACALYTVHNEARGCHLTKDMFNQAILTFYASMFDKGLFSDDEEIYKRATESGDSINKLLEYYLQYLKEHKNPDGLIHFVSNIIKQIPSCQHLGAFSIEGVNFSTMLMDVIDTMNKDYSDLIASWDKSLDRPVTDDFIVETNPPISTVVATEPKKRNFGLIACIILLIISVIGNVYLCSEIKSQNSVATQKNDYWVNAYGEIYPVCYQLADQLESIKDEYLFFHEHAVVIIENNSFYHRLDCKTITVDSFWIHNKEFASSSGYKACPSCNPDNHGSLVIRQNIDSLIDAAPSKPMGPEEVYQ